MGQIFRIILVLGIVGYILTGGEPSGPVNPKPGPVEPYAGTYSGLHSASRSMTETDRAIMSAAFLAAGEMVASDRKGLLDKTTKIQDFVVATLEFNYNGSRSTNETYPAVSSEVEKILGQTIGDEVRSADASDRSKLEQMFREMSKAVA